MSLGVVYANKRAERENGTGSGSSIHVKLLTTGCFPALKLRPIPTRAARPRPYWLDGLRWMSYQGSFQALRQKEHQRHPSERGPNHENSPAHRFLPRGRRHKKRNIHGAAIQALSVLNVPIKLLILGMLASPQLFSRACTSCSQTAGSEKLAVPTCTAVAPTIMYSRTSSTVSIPPRPRIGILTARLDSNTSRSVRG